jgi:two-component system, cell cycle response regulator DivK
MSKLAYVIEDDLDLAKIYSEALKLGGFDVETLVDGQLAYNRIKEKKPDFVLLDMHLPHVSGNEILWLTWFDDLLESVKFTIITADRDMGRIYEPKGYQVLVKPVPFATLVEMAKTMYTETEKQDQSR